MPKQGLIVNTRTVERCEYVGFRRTQKAAAILSSISRASRRSRVLPFRTATRAIFKLVGLRFCSSDRVVAAQSATSSFGLVVKRLTLSTIFSTSSYAKAVSKASRTSPRRGEKVSVFSKSKYRSSNAWSICRINLSESSSEDRFLSRMGTRSEGM